MRQTAKIGIIWSAFLLLASCGTKRAGNNITTVVKDSTVTEVTYRKRDTTITIPGDTLKVKVPYYQLTQEPRTFASPTQKANVSLSENDILTIDCITEQVARLIEVTDTLKRTLKTIEKDSKEKIIVPEPYVPWYVKILAWIGGTFLVVLVATLVTKFIVK